MSRGQNAGRHNIKIGLNPVKMWKSSNIWGEPCQTKLYS